MRITKLALAMMVLCGFCFLAPLATNVYADEFQISWVGSYGDGTATVDATNEGGGEFLVTSILNGTQAGQSLTLLSPSGFSDNDNLIFPSSNPELSSGTGGLGFSDGTDDYVMWWGIAPPSGYYECSSAYGTCPNDSAPGAFELTSFSITPVTATPEAGTGWLLAGGSFGLLAISLRRKRIAQLEG